MLISHLQLCLAHYCDVHGPTPIMVTEGLPVPCSTCYDHDLADFSGAGDLPRKGSQGTSTLSAQTATAITDALRQINLSGAHRSSMSASEPEAQVRRVTLTRSASHTAAATRGSAVESPPVSPLTGSGVPTLSQHNKDSSFRRTYDTRRANPCDNCAMTLPKYGEGGADDSKPSAAGPTLRTRAPYARVYDSGATSPRSSQTTSSSSSDTEDTDHMDSNPQGLLPPYRHRRTGTIISTTSRSSASSSTARRSHTHYINYTSTHEPGETSFKIVRHSCLRTLSFEMLPRHPAMAPPPPGYQGTMPSASAAAAAAMMNNPYPCQGLSAPTSFVTTHSTGAAASGGPMFFGDPAAGYTTAYIFRIPDVHARGHKRVYALIALSTHRERQAMKPFGFIAKAFRDLAAWIQELAEAEAERAAEAAGGSGSGGSGSSPVVMNTPHYTSAAFERVATNAGGPGSGSGFLAAAGSGLSRRMGTGFGGSVGVPRARGLPEVVGLPNFFIELHARFVQLLLELGVVLNS